MSDTAVVDYLENRWKKAERESEESKTIARRNKQAIESVDKMVTKLADTRTMCEAALAQMPNIEHLFTPYSRQTTQGTTTAQSQSLVVTT